MANDAGVKIFKGLAIGCAVVIVFIVLLVNLTGTGGNKVGLIGSEGSDLLQVFQIVSDESKPPYKRVVEVSLKHRVSEGDLRLIAEYIKAQETSKVDNTFIGYRHIEQPEGTPYWATTHYSPKLEVQVLGLTSSQMQQMDKDIAARHYEKPIAAWVDEGGIPRVRVLSVKSGELVLDQIFRDGTSSSHKAVASRMADGKIRIKEDNDDEDEFSTINEGGVLTLWGGGKSYLVLRPYAVVPVNLAFIDALNK